MVMFLFWISQRLSQLIIIHGNLFQVDILGLADLAGDIFLIRGKGT